MKRLIVIGGLLAATGSYAQTEVAAYQPGRYNEGVTYFLPKTSIDISVTAEKVTYTPGEFARYADKYLRLQGVELNVSEHWEIKHVRIIPVGTPDTDKAFTVKFRDNTVAPLVDLTEDGILKAINTTLPALRPSEKEEEPKLPALNPRNYMTEEILQAGSTAKMAELTAAEIYAIRDSKNAITRGQAENMPKDGESLKIMLNSLSEQERALMQSFTGLTERKTRTVTVRLTPSGDIDRKVILRFSSKLGILPDSDLAGAPLRLTLTDQHNVPAPVETEKGRKKPDGIVYNVPGKADLILSDGRKELYKGELMLGQFGNTETLAGSLFNKKTTTRITFDPTTGGLIRIEAAD